jgi:nucleoside-diphosphate-sugar epimerase
MKLLVIGGTSFFGKDIVELALDAGHQVTLFSRGNQRPGFWNRVEHIAGDRTDSVDFGQKLALRQFDVVIDNIAFNGEQVASALSLFRGNIGRYLMTSSAAVYINAGPFDEPLTEADTDLAPPPASRLEKESRARYAAGKMAAERTVMGQADVPWTILRPPYVAGPEDPNGICQFYFQRLLDGGPLIVRDGGYHPLHAVYRRDLAQSFLLAAGSDKAANQVYNIAQEKSFRLVDWIKLGAVCLGVPPHLVNIPAEVLREADFDYGEPVTSQLKVLNTAKARADLGLQSTPVAAWTATTANWYLAVRDEATTAGYDQRQKEVAFARRYLEAVGRLSS